MNESKYAFPNKTFGQETLIYFVNVVAFKIEIYDNGIIYQLISLFR